MSGTLTRRTFLLAGTAGAAALAAGSVLRPSIARAAAAGSTPAAGVHPLNDGWLFGGHYAAGAETPGYAEDGFSAVVVPHVVTGLSWGDWDHTQWEQVWVYRRHLFVAPAAGQRVFVDFGAVMTNATVYLNGIALASHHGGYLPFSVELTDLLTGSDDVLALIVDGRWLDVPPSGNSGGAWSVDYFQPAGIHRDVTLRVVPDAYISDIDAVPGGVLTTSPSLAVTTTVDTGSMTSGTIGVTVSLTPAGATTPIATGSTRTAATGSGSAIATVTLSGLNGIALWSPEHPNLYTVSVTISAGGVTHSAQVRTGFRDAQFRLGSSPGFYLNGSRYEIFGLNRHGLFPYTGMGAAARLQRRDAELLRNELNCNMVRCSHYPQSPDFLDACDELGLMVWQEPPGWQYIGGTTFQQIVVQNVADMVMRDRNRPAVIVWGTRLNETGADQTLYAQTRQVAAQLDPTRPSTGALAVQTQPGWAEDVYAFDDYRSVGNNHQDATLLAPRTDVPYMVSEAVGALDGAPLYRWIDTEQTLALQARMHAQVHDIAQGNSAFAGLLAWAGFDYASLSGGNRIWHNVKWPGVIDTFRIPKPAASFYRSQVAPGTRPEVLPVFFWDFGSSDSGGPGSAAMIATNCDLVRLTVNGTVVATGAPDRTTYPHLAHPPLTVDLSSQTGSGNPDLQIDGIVGGRVVTTVKMSSDPSHDVLSLTVEDATIDGDGTDATRFTLRRLDRYGNPRPEINATDTVALSLSGPATLVSDNPFPFGELGGVGGGFIRSLPGQTGKVTLTATHPSLAPAGVTATVTVAAASGAGPVSPGTAVSPRLLNPPAPPGPPATPAAGGSSPASTATSTTPSSSPSSGAQPGATSPASGHTGVALTTIRRALRAILTPSGTAARVAEILRHGGVTEHFNAPEAGTVVVDWFEVRPAGPRSRPRSILVARGQATAHHPGRITLHVRLTGPGRNLLRSHRRQVLTTRASFIPLGGSAVTVSGTITLHAG